MGCVNCRQREISVTPMEKIKSTPNSESKPKPKKPSSESIEKIKIADVELNEEREIYLENKTLKIKKKQFIQEFTSSPFEKYKKLQVLGEGAYGKVWKVVETEGEILQSENINHHKIGSNKSLIPAYRAMKEIKKVKKTKLEYFRIKKELEILSKLDHPNILKVFEFYDWEEYYYIITEFCEGGELFDRITKYSHFNEKIAANIMKQILSVVLFCNENNVVHRDLKPENILLESKLEDNFNIKVIDFGTGEKFKCGREFVQGELNEKGRMRNMNKHIGTPYYIAPEVLNREYNEKCDIWSCGVILYVLLSGCPPFYGKNDEEIYSAVKKSIFSFKMKIWDEISENAKDLIGKLLEVDINKRLTAEEAMRHRWFEGVEVDHKAVNPRLRLCTDLDTDADCSVKKSTQNFKAADGVVIKQALKNLKNFRAERKLQQATLYFLVHNLTANNQSEVEYLKNIFQKMDENHDGKLEKDEIMKGFKSCGQWINFTEAEIEKIMEKVDGDNNGYIEYQEFLTATLDTKKLLTDENLLLAFKMFDKDDNGKISSEELRTVLGVGNEKSSERVWKKIVSDIDTDGDGEISFEEFKEMMCNLVTSA